MHFSGFRGGRGILDVGGVKAISDSTRMISKHVLVDISYTYFNYLVYFT